MRAAHALGLVAIASLAACGFGGSSSGRTSASTTAPSTSATTTPTTSSTLSVPTTSTTTTTAPPATTPKTGIAGVVPGKPAIGLEFIPGNAASRYALYVPSTYNGAPVGIVVAFHGVEGTPDPYNWFLACVLYGNKDRFIVVAPYGDVNDNGSGAWTQPYAKEILELVKSSYAVDPHRVYMSAISGGCLPGIMFALADTPKTYVTPVGNYTVNCGYQSDFAAVGFTAPAYSPNLSPDFKNVGMQSLGTVTLGFTPSGWTDWGELSQNEPAARDLQSFMTTLGYSPVSAVVRPGEGHAPQPPYSYVAQMFDQFAATTKP